MAKTTKQMSDADGQQSLQYSYNDSDASLNISGFLTSVVGRKITLTLSTTTISNDTETYVFSENSLNLYTYKIIYTDGARTVMLTAERTA